MGVLRSLPAAGDLDCPKQTNKNLILANTHIIEHHHYKECEDFYIVVVMYTYVKQEVYYYYRNQCTILVIPTRF